MDLPDQELYQQLNARRVSGEHLEVLGKKAAADWAQGEYGTLTEAVVSIVKHAGLSPEQVRRVVEFANTDAYLKEFRKEGSHKVVDFGKGGPADPSDVLKDLNDGGGGTVFDRGTSDYDQPPTGTKTASARVEEELFGLLRATGPTEYPEANPYGDVMDLRDKLAGISDTFNSQINSLEVLYGDVSGEVYRQVKQAALGGYTLGEVLQAVQGVTPSADHVKVAFAFMGPKLLEDGVCSSLTELGASLEKTGSVRAVNQHHPLVASFVEYCTVLDKLAEIRAARDEVHVALEQTTSFLKRASAASTVGKLHEGAKVLGARAAPFVSEHLGQGAGKAVQLASSAAVPAAGLVTANEIRRHLAHNPLVHKALSTVPGTSDYQQREFELAQRGGY
jgi:hypothetical protein